MTSNQVIQTEELSVDQYVSWQHTTEHGDQVWYLNNHLHRSNGPAYITPAGTESWFRYGVRHREDGPAITRVNGSVEWYLDGALYSFNEWLKRTPLEEEQKLLLKLIYG